MKNLILAVLALAGFASAQISSLSLPHTLDSATIPKVSYVDDNDVALKNRLNIVIDSVNADSILTLLQSNSSLRLTIDADANATGTCFAVTHNGAADTIAKFCDDLSARNYGALTVSGTLGVTGAQTNTVLVGTGTRLVTATSAGVLGNATTIAGANEFSALQAFAVGINFSGNGSSAVASIYRTAGSGLTMRGVTGSSNDFGIESAAGSNILINPTGTSSVTFPGTNVTISGTATTTGVHTFTAAPVYTALTASLPMFTNGSNAATSNAMTGTGSVVMSTSPTLVTPALGIATATRISTSSNTNSVVVTAATDAASSLQVGGSYSEAVSTMTGNTTLDLTYATIEASATGGSFTITLPAASVCIGRRYTIHKNDASANTVTVDANASETIDGDLTIVLGGNVGNSHLIIKSNGTNWRIEQLYEEGSFTATLTGGTTSPTATCYYVRSGKFVTLQLAPTTNVTSNATSFTYTGLPSSIQPTTAQIIPIAFARDNGASVGHVAAHVSPGSDVIAFYLNFLSTGWTSSGSKGLSSTGKTFTYTLQ